MANAIKALVSKNRKRYVQDGFDLDLTYINHNLIAMGFPADKLESIYRNNVDDVIRFLESKHKEHYFVYNLCSERRYDPAKFHNRVRTFPFDDHNTPKLEMVQDFCQHVHDWLARNEENVAVIHCKAGKGRTGVMICCYLLYSQQCSSADEALMYYGEKRTHDHKGVTIPSQRRYVEYFSRLVRERLDYVPNSSPLWLTAIEVSPWVSPVNPLQQNFTLVISQTTNRSQKQRFTCVLDAGGKGQKILNDFSQTPVRVCGDVKVELYSNFKVMSKKERLFHFWFNTFFVWHQAPGVVANGVATTGTEYRGGSHSLPHRPRTFHLVLKKDELDKAHKKNHKVFPSNFQVIAIFNSESNSETGLNLSHNELHPDSSFSDSNNSSTEEDDEDGDSDVERPCKNSMSRPLSCGWNMCS